MPSRDYRSHVGWEDIDDGVAGFKTLNKNTPSKQDSSNVSSFNNGYEPIERTYGVSNDNVNIYGNAKNPLSKVSVIVLFL